MQTTDTEKEGILPEVPDEHEMSSVASTGGRIMQEEEEAIVIPDDDSSIQSSVTSETIEEFTVSESKQSKKLKDLKRKLIPSRQSPRVKIAKLDIKKGAKSGLKPKEKTAVEHLAKSVVSKFTSSAPLPVKHSRGKSSCVSSVSGSSQSSGRHRSVLQMYAEAALRIPRTSATRSSAPQPQPPRITQQQQQQSQAAEPGPPQITQQQSQAA